MAEKKTSHSQHSAAHQEILEKMESAWEQAASMERKTIEQANAAIEESARLMKEALAWQSQINAEWRKLALEATRRMNVGFGVRS